MMSHEDPNDLIVAVTAEIEAIIQEEIDSQNSSELVNETETRSAEETFVQAPSEESVQNNSDPGEQYAGNFSAIVENVNDSSVNVFTSVEEAPASVSIEIDSAPTLIEEIPVLTEEVPAPDNTLIDDTAVPSAIADIEIVKEEFIEYTVPVVSPSKDAVSDVVESVSSTPLIETILNDAPIDEHDGPRARHLKQALRKALNNTVKSCR